MITSCFKMKIQDAEELTVSILVVKNLQKTTKKSEVIGYNCGKIIIPMDFHT